MFSCLKVIMALNLYTIHLCCLKSAIQNASYMIVDNVEYIQYCEIGDKRPLEQNTNFEFKTVFFINGTVKSEGLELNDLRIKRKVSVNFCFGEKMFGVCFVVCSEMLIVTVISSDHHNRRKKNEVVMFPSQWFCLYLERDISNHPFNSNEGSSIGEFFPYSLGYY